MNKKEVVERVSEKSGVDKEVCEKVIKAFEKQFGDTILRKIKREKNNRADIAKSISEKSNLVLSDCEKVLAVFEEVVGEELTAQLKFWK
ncbi:MAG: hypothetical protein LBU83_01730 [Bacteroidales bacterium]|jgi:nucleoid DNA-binding protein|nr:hypothetical protein [Bacteroidales bacterium]